MAHRSSSEIKARRSIAEECDTTGGCGRSDCRICGDGTSKTKTCNARQPCDSTFYLCYVLICMMVLFVYPICVPETDPSKYAFLIWLAWKAPMVLAMISFIIMTIAACLADPKTTSAGKLGDILSGIAVISCLLYGYGSFVWVAASSTTLIGDSDDPKDNFDSSNTQEVILVIVLVCAFLALLMVLLIFSYYVVVMIKERVSSLKLFSKKRCGKKDLELGEADGASGPQSCVPIMMKDVDHDEPV